MNTDPAAIRPKNWRRSQSHNRRHWQDLENDEILMTKAERMVKSESPTSFNGVGLACSGCGHSNADIRSSRGNEAHSPRGTCLKSEPPHVGCYPSEQTAQKFWSDLFLPLPATQEWGEDRLPAATGAAQAGGEGNPTSLLSPALSSIRWRRGSVLGSGCTAL